MEIGYCTLHDLLKIKKKLKSPFSSEQIYCLMYSLTEALKIMHGNTLYHLDLKLENIALDLTLS